MTDLNTASTRLKAVHQKFGISGNFERKANISTMWPAGLPRSPEIDIYFENINPLGVHIETGFTPLDLCEFDKLERAQLGYRWIQGPNEKERITEWPTHYLVFMDGSGGGKPIIADTSTAETPIYASYDVAKPFKIADSLAQFLLALAELIEIVYGQYEIFEIADEEDNIIPEFFDELTSQIVPILGKENFGNFYDYFYG